MQKYFDNVLGGVTGFGAIAGASVLVKNINGTVATIYANNGTLTKTNPLITDAAGYFEFYAPDGRYTLEVTAAGFTSVQRQDILLEDPADPSAATFSSVSVQDSFSANSGSFSGPLTVQTPVNSNNPATKSYVDAADAAVTAATQTAATQAAASAASASTSASSASASATSAANSAASALASADSASASATSAAASAAEAQAAAVASYISPVPYVKSDTLQNMITKLLVLAKVIPESVPFVDANFNDPAY